MNDLIDRFNSIALAQKLIILVLLMVGIFVGFLIGIQQPIADEIERLDQRATSLQREVGNLERVRQNQAEVAAELDDLTRRLDDARVQLPERAEIPNLLQRIHGQAQTVGLSIERFRRNEDVAGSDFIEIPVEMELVGTFDEVANFFYSVGRMPRIVNIRDIRMQRAASGLNPEGVLIVRARATTYRWNPR
jgi:type IV pilus assembly protein PilO